MKYLCSIAFSANVRMTSFLSFTTTNQEDFSVEKKSHTVSDFTENMAFFAQLLATKLTSHFWGFSV